MENVDTDAIAVLLTILTLYLIPSIIAWMRRHHQFGSIIVLNIFLGWTFLGWIGALVWSVGAVNKPVAN